MTDKIQSATAAQGSVERETLAVRVSHMSKWFTDQSYEATTLREVVEALRTSQPSPAATVATKSAPGANGSRLHVESDPSVTLDFPGAGTQCSAGSDAVDRLSERKLSCRELARYIWDRANNEPDCFEQDIARLIANERKAAVSRALPQPSADSGDSKLPLQYEDGPDYCTVRDAQGRDFALTVQPKLMQAMENALGADIDRLRAAPQPPANNDYVQMPREATRAMTMAACDRLPSCEHVFGHAGEILRSVYEQMVKVAAVETSTGTAEVANNDLWAR